METDCFRAVVLEKGDDGVTSEIRTLSNDRLPEGDVTVAVEYSTVNYKDGLVLGGLGRLVREYPHVSGIDFAGVVEHSSSPRFKAGDKVVLTGWRVGEIHWGGHASRARVKAGWLVPLPDALSTRQAMAIGTAGFTAMLSVMALEEHGLTPGEDPVLITGAAGGVGSVATAILAKLGHKVAASTGRAKEKSYLKDLGAAEVVDREDTYAPPKGPLGAERWAGVIDNVGGNGLAAVLASIRYGGSCAAVGNAGGLDFGGNVIPFLLRGINLLGIDSVMCPRPRREEAWRRLAQDLPLDKLDATVHEASLADVPELGGKILRGEVRGRAVIDVNA